MIAHPDTQASRYPPQENRNEGSFPCEEEQRRDSADVKGSHNKSGHPIGLVVGWPLSFERLKLHCFDLPPAPIRLHRNLRILLRTSDRMVKTAHSPQSC